MARVIISPEADADSATILAELATKAGARIADRYEDDFDAVYRRLADFPGTGAPRQKLGKNVRLCLVSPYLIFYEYDETGSDVMILRIAHGRRKITRKFLRGRT